MAKNKSTRKDRRAKDRNAAKRAPSSVGPSTPDYAPPRSGVLLDSLFGKIEVPEGLVGRFSERTEGVDPDGFTHLDLSDCEHDLTTLTPGLARRALVEAEGMDPRVADQLVNGFVILMPALMIWGERGRLLAAAPTLRRVRGASLYSGDTHAALMGMVYGLPGVVLAEFENGPAVHRAAEELVRKFEAWQGRLLVLLIDGSKADQRIDEGRILAAHEVDLDRPILWHLGERGPSTSR